MLLQNVTQDPFPEQIEYQVPPPPPLNGHNPPSPPPTNEDAPPLPSEYTTPAPAPQIQEWSRMSSLSNISTPLNIHQKMRPPQRPGVFSGILYFIGVIIVTFELFAILVNFGTGATIGLIGILLAIVIVVASIVFFVRLVQQHTASLRWWQRLLWLVGLTVAAFVLLIINVLFSPSKTMTNVIMSSVFVLYGLVWCLIAIW